MRLRTPLAVALGIGALAFTAAPDAAADVSSHSQLHACCTDPAVADAMFGQAKASGASSMRIAVEMHDVFSVGPLGIVFNDWSRLDHIASLSVKHGLPVDATLLGSPVPAAGCAAGQTLCPPADPAAWGQLAGRMAGRYRHRGFDSFEIWNEPDGAWAFAGTPEDYGRILAAGYDGIKARDPDAAVVLGGTMHSNADGTAWLDRAFRTPGTNASQKFDVGAIHLRGRIARMVGQLADRRAFFAAWRRDVPIWVTEHGYAATPAWQRDPAYRGGAQDQAAYLGRSLAALAAAGSARTFVTLIDAGPGPYESEGILAGRGMPGEALVRRPAFHAVRRAAGAEMR